MGEAALPPWQFFGLRWPSPGVYKLGLMVNSKRAHVPRGTSLDCSCQCPHPCSEPWPTHRTSSSTKQVVFCEVTVPFPWVLEHTRFCLYPSRVESLFPPVCGSSIVKFHWPSRSVSVGIPSPFARYPGWEAWHGSQNLHNSRRTSLVLLSSSLWVTHPTSMGFDFMVTAALLTILLQLLLCLWTWGIYFWWVPASSCRWLFNS